MSQGEGADASSPSRLPGGAGHPAAVGGWGGSATDHQPRLEFCLRPVSLTPRGAHWFRCLGFVSNALKVYCENVGSV